MTEKKKEKKYEMLVRRSKEIASEYTVKLTVRQIFYRLVQALDIEANRSQYVYFDRVITKYRQKNLPFADLFKDDTREIVNTSGIDYPLYSYSDSIESQINYVKTGYPYYTWNKNLLQDKVNIILLEKRTLQDLFTQSITPNTILVIAGGINSFTQMNELRKLINNENRELKLYIFTDFDDTGYLIQDNFLLQTKEHLNITFDTIERVALTKELVEKYDIPINFETKPKKQAKSTHKDYNLPYFVELDGIEPNLLMDLVKKTCEQNFNNDLYNSINKALRIRNRRLKKAYFRELKKIDLTKL